jgi:hypothetical protein
MATEARAGNPSTHYVFTSAKNEEYDPNGKAALRDRSGLRLVGIPV